MILQQLYLLWKNAQKWINMNVPYNLKYQFDFSAENVFVFNCTLLRSNKIWCNLSSIYQDKGLGLGAEKHTDESQKKGKRKLGEVSDAKNVSNFTA